MRRRISTLGGLCKEVAEQSNIEVNFQSLQVPTGMSSDVSLSIFRVAQESLHNIAKHAKARRVQVELLGTSTSVVLRVSDDGIGFDPEASKHRPGLGMISMKERIRSVGGTISFSSKPSMGTQLETTIPVVEMPVAAADIF